MDRDSRLAKWPPLCHGAIGMIDRLQGVRWSLRLLAAGLAVWIALMCGALASNAEAPTKRFFDDGDVFRKVPDERARLEQALNHFNERYKVSLFVVTRSSLYGDTISAAAQQLCRELLGRKFGIVMLYDESAKVLFLATPLEIEWSESLHPDGPYLSTQWLTDQFLSISRDIARRVDVKLDSAQYISSVCYQLLNDLSKQATPGDQRQWGRWIWGIAAILAVLYVAWLVLARLNARKLVFNQAQYRFPQVQMLERFEAKNGGGLLTSRVWDVQHRKISRAPEGMSFGGISPAPIGFQRKRVTGRVMAAELLRQLHEGKITDKELCARYEIIPKTLARWKRNIVIEQDEPSQKLQNMFSPADLQRIAMLLSGSVQQVNPQDVTLNVRPVKLLPEDDSSTDAPS